MAKINSHLSRIASLRRVLVTLIVASWLMLFSLPALAAPVTTPAPKAPATSSPTDLQGAIKDNPVNKDLQMFINFLSAGVGLVVVTVIILGGVQYIAAGDKPDALGAAKKRIANGLIALLTFFLMYAFLQWLIKGGAFK